MIKYVCVVDDDTYKRKRVVDSAKILFPEAKIYTMTYANELLMFVRMDCLGRILECPDEWLMLVDMQMPFEKSGRVEIDCGVSVLKEMDRKRLKCSAVIVLAEGLSKEMSQEVQCYSGYKGFVRYGVCRDLEEPLRGLLADYLNDSVEK